MKAANVQQTVEQLERAHPGKTIVIDSRTLKVLAISKSHTQIARKLRTLKQDIVPLFIGGPQSERELAFNRFCAPADLSLGI